jgi:CRISPR-associated exonuclease Cas4
MQDDLLPISALQHWSYCPRQCALIHIEQQFVENVHTLRGQAVHARVNVPEIEILPGRTVERAMPLWNERIGLIGKADVVEFLSDGTPYPVEYKHGPKRKKLHDELQLCAQALCLEEMLGRTVTMGAIYHASSKRRREVAIDQNLRASTLAAITLTRALLAQNTLPVPANDARCNACSLIALCQPDLAAIARAVKTGFDTLFEDAEEEFRPHTTESTASRRVP